MNILGFYDFSKTTKTFNISFSKDNIERLYNSRTAEGDIYVRSRGNGLVFAFKGVQSLEEWCNAVIYVFHKDLRSKGALTNAAREGFNVYTHSMCDYVARYISKIRW